MKNTIKQHIEKFIKDFCTVADETVTEEEMNAMLDEHDVIVYGDVAYYVPNMILLSDDERMIKEILIAVTDAATDLAEV